VGKTQLGVQLAVNAQIPRLLGGLGGRAVYVGGRARAPAEAWARPCAAQRSSAPQSRSRLLRSLLPRPLPANPCWRNGPALLRLGSPVAARLQKHRPPAPRRHRGLVHGRPRRRRSVRHGGARPRLRAARRRPGPHRRGARAWRVGANTHTRTCARPHARTRARAHTQTHARTHHTHTLPHAQAERFTVESVLEGILCFRAHDHAQQLALMRTLGALLAGMPEARARARGRAGAGAGAGAGQGGSRGAKKCGASGRGHAHPARARAQARARMQALTCTCEPFHARADRSTPPSIIIKSTLRIP
jgi:hypothetical protein